MNKKIAPFFAFSLFILMATTGATCKDKDASKNAEDAPTYTDTTENMDDGGEMPSEDESGVEGASE